MRVEKGPGQKEDSTRTGLAQNKDKTSPESGQNQDRSGGLPLLRLSENSPVDFNNLIITAIRFHLG